MRIVYTQANFLEVYFEVKAFDPQSTEVLLDVVHKHEAQFVELLQSNGVKIRVFLDFEELEEYMELL